MMNANDELLGTSVENLLFETHAYLNQMLKNERHYGK